MLDIDALGEKGEQRFGEMCAEAGLICNKAGRDRAGWDFIVNFGAPGAGALDRRSGALSCYVQIKTILDETRAAKLKLNMAERLAKEPKPAFVVVFKVNSRKEFTKVFLIHVADNRLGAILKRLRQEQRDNSDCQLHKKSISFAPTETEKIELNGDSLKLAMLRHIGSDLSGYIDRKQVSLEKLGFDDRPYSITTTFHDLTASDMVDVFLGLRGRIPNTTVRVSETRFDITITEPESVCEILFVPSPHDSCKILYRASPSDIPITFRGEVLAAPPILQVQKIRIRCPLIDFVIEKTRDDTTINYSFAPGDKKCTASDWMNCWKLAVGLLSGKGTLEFQIDSSGKSTRTRAAPHQTDHMRQILVEAQKFLQTSEALLNLCRHAGVESDLLFSSDDVASNYREILVFSDLITGRRQHKINIDADTESSFLDENPELVVVAGCFGIGGRRFSVYGVVDVDVDHQASKVSLHGFKFRELRVIPNTDVAYKNFVADASRVEGISSHLFLGSVSTEEEGGALRDQTTEFPRLLE